MTGLIKSVSSVATTNDYADLIAVEVPTFVKEVLIWLKEENTNAIKYIIYGSQDNSRWETLLAETVLAKNGSTYETVKEPWLYLKVQHKASVGGTQGATTCFMTGM